MAMMSKCVLLLLATGISTARKTYPMPEETTPIQQSVLDRKFAEAKAASDAATPSLLDFLSSPDIDAILEDCCSSIAALSPQGRLEALRKSIRGSELVHNLPTNGENFFGDITPELMEEYGWFMNGWQAQIINGWQHQTVTAGSPNINTLVPRSMRIPWFEKRANSSHHPSKFLPIAEESIFGCPAFADPSKPTWDEASNRLIYVAHNMRQVDTGNTVFFGNVSAVFRTSHVRNNVLIAAIDTGIWEGSCNKSAGPDLPLNCSYWQPPTVGTLDHHDHLIVSNLGLSGENTSTVAQQAKSVFSRSSLADASYDHIPKIGSGDVTKYLEADIIGNPRFPGAVKFLIPSFVNLFGTPRGADIRKLADQYSWPLVWALGDVEKTRKQHEYPANARLLDPLAVAVKQLNVSLPDGAVAGFSAVWREVETVRSSGVNVTSAQLENWWAKLKAAGQIRLAPASEFSCGDLDRCIGIRVEGGDCVCEEASSSY